MRESRLIAWGNMANATPVGLQPLAANFGSAVYAATFSFSATIGGAAFAKSWGPFSAAVVPRIFLGVMVLAYMVDDWYGSRECLCRAGQADIQPRRSRLRFFLDLAIAVLCYPMLMLALHGLVFLAILTAVHMLLGAWWLYTCKREWPPIPQWPSAHQELHLRMVLHVIAALVILALSVYIMGFYRSDRSDGWSGRFYDGGWIAGIYFFLFLLAYRVVMPRAFDRGANPAPPPGPPQAPSPLPAGSQ